MWFSKTCFFAFIVRHTYFSEHVQLIAEVARLQFLLITFISQQAFSHLFLRTQYIVFFNRELKLSSSPSGWAWLFTSTVTFLKYGTFFHTRSDQKTGKCGAKTTVAPLICPHILSTLLVISYLFSPIVPPWHQYITDRLIWNLVQDYLTGPARWRRRQLQYI